MISEVKTKLGWTQARKIERDDVSWMIMITATTTDCYYTKYPKRVEAKDKKRKKKKAMYISFTIAYSQTCISKVLPSFAILIS